jgi:hypothetical protein
MGVGCAVKKPKHNASTGADPEPERAVHSDFFDGLLLLTMTLVGQTANLWFKVEIQ